MRQRRPAYVLALLGVLVAPAGAAGAATAPPAPPVAVVRPLDLATLGGPFAATDYSNAWLVNERGQVAGTYYDAAAEVTRPFFWRGRGAPVRMTGLPDVDLYPVDMNDSGQVLVITPAGGLAPVPRTWLWSPSGRVQPVEVPGALGTAGVDLNERGQVLAGWTTPGTPPWPTTGFWLYNRVGVWAAGRMTPVPGLPSVAEAPVVRGAAINDAGVVVGDASVTARPGPFAWRSDGRTLTDITPPGANDAVPADINERGEVAIGSRTTDTENPYVWRAGRFRKVSLPGAGALGTTLPGTRVLGDRGDLLVNDRYTSYLWRDGRASRLPEPPQAETTFPATLNDVGQVVGNASLTGPDYVYRGYLAERDRVVELGTVGGRFSNAMAVNDSGTVAGSADTSPDLETSRTHAVVWRVP